MSYSNLNTKIENEPSRRVMFVWGVPAKGKYFRLK